MAVFVFLKNAWVAEDAYIVFRSLEQLFAGHGPIWNPHERVQAFTSPLWFCVLALARLVSQDLFIGTIVVSCILWFGTLAALKTIFGKPSSLLFAVLLLCGSTGFYDYTSSGLENVLAYFVIALYLKAYLPPKKHLTRMCVFLGLLVVVRHDLVLLLLPPTIATIWEYRRLLSIRRRATLCGIAVMPLLIYTICSTVYYGFPFPNTAYAKLNTGIDQRLLWEQGVKYFVSSIRFDTITLLVIGSALIWTTMRAPAHRYLAAGIALDLLYVAYVGGDFMQGRFLSYAYLVSVVLCTLALEQVHPRRLKAVAGVAVCSYLVLYPHTPFNSSPTHSDLNIRFGVADERGHYFNELSLLRYLKRDRDRPYFPVSEAAERGRQLRASSDDAAVVLAIGVFGYHAGVDKIIVDQLALSDPLLARMPVRNTWRIGHFPRDLPEGYLETLRRGKNVIVDPGVSEFYEQLKIVTQSTPLFTKERLETILLFNVGAYDHLLRDE